MNLLQTIKNDIGKMFHAVASLVRHDDTPVLVVAAAAAAAADPAVVALENEGGNVAAAAGATAALVVDTHEASSDAKNVIVLLVNTVSDALKNVPVNADGSVSVTLDAKEVAAFKQVEATILASVAV